MNDLRNSPVWRLAAYAALSLLALTALFGIWLIIRNPLLAIIFGLTCAGLAGAAWQGLFARKSKRRWPYLLAITALILVIALEILFFFRDKRSVWILLVMFALVSAGLGLGSALRRRYLTGRDAVAIPAGSKPFLIVNPKSGDGRAIKQDIPRLAEAKGIRVLLLESGGSLSDLVDQAINEGATILGMSGGDGSLGLAAEAAMRRDLPLVVLPGGTRCHFARDIGLDPENMADALRAFGGPEVRIDAAEINGRVFLNNASFGMYADIVHQPGYREHKLEATMEVLRSQADKSGYALNFQDGDGTHRDRAVAVLVGANRYETMDVTELGTRSRLDEGVLQMTAVFHLEESLVKQLAGVVKLKQTAGSSPSNISQWVAQEFEISGTAPNLEAGVDGELVELASPVRLRILPSGLRLKVPPEGIQPRRSSRSAIARLTDYAVRGRLPHDS